MTIGLGILLGIILIGGLAFAGWCFYEEGAKVGLCVALVTIVLTVIILGCCGFWEGNNTAAGARALKDQQSNLSNGLNCEIIVTAEDGREIFYYKGKCDIETDHDDNYILFEGEDGLRRMIYYGITDTVLIMELPDD